MTAMERLPATVRTILERGDRDGHALTPSEREQIASMLMDVGIQGAGNLAWMALLIRHRLGVGDTPTPPGSLLRQGYAYELARQRAEFIAKVMLNVRRAVV